MAMNGQGRVLVIGAGVVGICCALSLQRDGKRVTVVTRDPVGDGTARASCGWLAVNEIQPLSRPGILRKVPGWLFDPTGPLSIRPSSALSVLPWLLRFVGNARPERMAEISRDMTALAVTARSDYEALLEPLDLLGLIRGEPLIKLFDNAAEIAHERPRFQAAREHGFDIEEISGAEAAEREPALARDLPGAFLFHDYRSIVDSKRFVTAMAEAFVAAGGEFREAEVAGFARDGGRVTGVVLADGGRIEAEQLVLSAGARSKKLAAELGLRLPIEGVIGYQTQLAEPGVRPVHPISYESGGFGITPYESGLAIAGSLEFASLEAAPDWRRARVLVERAKRILPGLATDGVARTERIGRRPMTPDTRPIIDRAPGAENVLIATGHGMLGVTLAATTGKLVAHLAAGRTPNIDLRPYRATRFQGG